MKKIIILSLAIISVISACRKKLDIDIPEADKNIVVNGIITPDSLIKINISKSQNSLDNGKIPYLETATVKLYEDDEFIEELSHTTSGNYISTINPEINKKYKINVDYENLKSVNAKIELINSVEIISIDTSKVVSTEDYGGENSKFFLKIKFDDNANEENYYFISLTISVPEYAYAEDTTIFIGMTELLAGVNSNDPVFRNEDSYFNFEGMEGRAFSDKLFNGKQYTLKVNTTYWNGNYSPYGYQEYDTEQTTVKIKLLTINRDIYNYIISYNLNDQTGDDPFAQPVQVYTNIENGLGLFSGYTMYEDSVIFDL